MEYTLYQLKIDRLLLLQSDLESSRCKFSMIGEPSYPDQIILIITEFPDSPASIDALYRLF